MSTNDLRIVDAPAMPEAEFTPEVKLPTGGKGNYSVTADIISSFVKKNKNLIDKTYLDTAISNLNANISAHEGNFNNPHKVTKAQLGLSNVNNTADLNKPVSNATTTAINSLSDIVAVKADKNSVYTKVETDSKLDTKASQEQFSLTQQKLSRENVSVWDFFTTAELTAYKATPTTFDAYRPIQAFFDHIATTNVGIAHCSGVFAVSQGLLLGRTTCVTKCVDGSLYLTALGVIDVMLTANTGGNFTWDGLISLTGAYVGSRWDYLNKRCRVGFLLPKTSGNGRCNFGTVIASTFRQAGVFVEDNATLSNFRLVRCSNIGTGYSGRQYKVGYTNVVNTGSSGSGGQLSTITVNSLPEVDLVCQRFVYLSGTLHLVMSVDSTNNTISVYPWVVDTVTSGDLEYIWGSGVDVLSGDSSCVNFDVVDVADSTIGLTARSLYLPSVGQLCVQSSRLGIVEGNAPLSAGSGGSIGNYYTESMLYDLVFVTLWGDLGRLRILSSYETKIEKTTWIGARYDSGTYASQGNTVKGFQYGFKGYNYFCESVYQEFKSASSQNLVAVDLFSQNLWRQVYNKNTLVFNLSEFTAENVMKARMFGLSTGLIHVIGTGVNSAPTTVTFPISSVAGYTLNSGTTDLVFSDFSGIGEFVIYIEVAKKNYIIKQVGTALKGSTTYDPPSIEPNSSVVKTVTLTGVKVGDIVQASFDQYNANIEIQSQVSSANTVSVKLKNTGVSAVDLPSGILSVKKI